MKRDFHATVVVLAAGANGLGVVRSLHASGVSCIVACRSKLDLSFLSRLPVRKVLIPAHVQLQEWLTQFIETMENDADCIIPCSDEFASAIRQFNEESNRKLPCILPPDDLVDILNDKKSEIELIRRIGVPHPPSILDVNRLDSNRAELGFPIIVKPRTFRGQEVLGAKNKILKDIEELETFLAEFSHALHTFIIQEVIPGDESCQWVCNATFDRNSEMVSAFTFQRYGTNPYMFGVTTVAVSRHNSDVKTLCARIGRALNYAGPAMFEFKVDPRTTRYCYIETNPRLGMCNWFDTRCHVNNAFNTYALSVGIEPERNIDDQRDGTCYLDITHDLYARLKAGQSVTRMLRHYVSCWLGRTVFPAWYWQDPLPAFSALVNYFFGQQRRARKKRTN